MSQATKRKHVVKEVLGDLIAPTENQQIVRILGSPGNNLHEAVTTQGEHFLVSMPTKFRKNIWIKRGDFVIVDPIEEGGKVRGEIVSILYKDHIRHLRSQGAWPEGFLADYTMEERRDREQTGGLTGEEKEGDEEDGGASGSEDDDSDLFVNTNRINYHYSESEEEEDEDEEEENSHEGKD